MNPSKALGSAALAAAIGLIGTSASAAVILVVDSNGLLTGANGVDVGGTLYDVSFGDGNANVLSPFTTSTTATTATNALANQVFITFTGQTWNGSSYASLTNETRYDLDPTKTRGCPDISNSPSVQATLFCAIWTTYAVSTSASFGLLRNQITEADLVTTTSIVASYNTGTTDTAGTFRTMATWTSHVALPTVTPPTTTNVPEPSTLASVLLALGIAGSLHRRRSQAA